ncbi:MAG: hypothetical protein SF028_07700 [Candidatus Sumerlaeia bacterium]|nr:hypothetical protein [Candidatus Sumerlaeia bacterium]
MRKLRYFRICGSFGAHFDEPDSLRVALQVGPVEEALEQFRRLGAEVVPDADAAGSSLRVVRVGGKLVYASSSPEVTVLHFIGSEPRGWSPLTTRQVDEAAAWEKWIEPLAGKLIDPPYFAELCVTPATRPDLWRER